MFTGQIAVISNRATWQSDTYELVDDTDGTTTDLTNPAINIQLAPGWSIVSSTGQVFDIVVTIRDIDGGYGLLNSSGCILATASIANGKVTIPGPGFQWQFEVADLAYLCAGTYRIGAKVTINGFVNDLIDGTIAVIEGN